VRDRLLPPGWRHFNLNYLAVLHDTFMAAASFVLALYLRLDTRFFEFTHRYLVPGLVLFTAICLLCFFSMRLYRGLWRYASMQDMVVIARAVTFAILAFYLILFALTRLENVPRSVPFIHWMLLMVMLGGPRFIYRFLKDRYLGISTVLAGKPRIPVLLIGANDHAELFLRACRQNPAAEYTVVALADSTPGMKGKYMHGVKILGPVEHVPAIIEKLTRRGQRPQKIILANPHALADDVRSLLKQAETAGIPLARLPRVMELKSGVSERLQIQPIAIEDLLGRPQNTLDRESMRQLVAGKRVMVTGAGGTIGGELVRQIANFAPAELLLYDAGEYNLYRIDHELAEGHAALPRQTVLGDIRDTHHLEAVFNHFRPELVFHAAAIKHVPLSESNREEALLTNVIGSRNIADACIKHKVAAMVMISTDKAVNPANLMGASKRLAESYCQALAAASKGNTRFITVRFGNVLGSTGSVVPLFQEQLARGGPITITHPDMVRFFMTVREAVELVLQAAALGMAEEAGGNGFIFVLDMGQPVRIEDLALQMIRLAGLRPHEDIAIHYTGLRPGEKLYEELFHDAESSVKTAHESIFLAAPRHADLKHLQSEIEKLEVACRLRRASHVTELLHALVPEYRPQNSQG
jgi:O-antigen biosynthesis protein WbqV